MEKYDFIKFINSKDIRAHLKKTGYELSERECAYVVCESYLPLKEKHEAYSKLIENTIDEKLRLTLAKRMELEKLLLDVFFQRDKAVYVYRYIDKDSNEESDEIYESCTKCMESAFDRNETAEFVRIEKRWIIGDDGENKTASVLLNKKGEIVNVSARRILNEELCEAFWSIVDLWQRPVSIPLPFERGDLLRTITDDVFVYESEWGKACMYGYMQNDYEDEDSPVGVYCVSNWLTAEYYTGKLKNVDKKLKDISSFLKGRMKLIDFIEKCRQMK